MPPGKDDWKFIHDDDDQTELWQNQATGETQEVKRDSPPLYEVAAEDIPDEPLYGPPK